MRCVGADGLVFPHSLLACYGRLENVPGVRCMIIYVRVRANLAGYVVMTNHMVCRNTIFLHQLPRQFNSRLNGSIFEVPVPAVCCLASFIPDTQLNTDTVGIPTFRMPVTFCPTVPGNVSILYALPDFPAKSHIVVGAGSDIFAGIIPAVGLRPAGSSDVVDHDVPDAVGVTQTIKVVRRQQFVNLHRQSPPFRPGPSHLDRWLPGSPAVLFPMLPWPPSEAL